MPFHPPLGRAPIQCTIEPLEARIAPAAVLSLSFTADTAKHVAHGQQIAFTLTVTNSGDAPATGVDLHVITDPNSFKSGDDTDGFTDNFNGTYDLVVPTLAPGGSDTEIFLLHVDTQMPTSVKTLTTEATVSSGQSQLPNHPPLQPVLAIDSPTDKTVVLPVYQGIYVLSSGIAKTNELGTSDLRVFDIATGNEVMDLLAYPNVNGKVVRDSFRVALGDFNGDGFDDIVVSTAHGTGPVKIFDGETGALIHSITPFNGKKGLFVAAADVTGDGQDDIVLGSALGGGALTVVDGATGQYIGTPVHPFGKHYTGSVRVAAADFDGVEGFPDRFNNHADDIVAAQGNFGNQIKIFSLGSLDDENGNPADFVERASFTAGGKHYRGGLNISVGDLDHDGQPEIVAGRNRLSAPIVDVFQVSLIDSPFNQIIHQTAKTSAATGTGILSAIELLDDLQGTKVQSFTAFAPGFRQGVRVSVGDLDGDGNADILVTAGYSGGSKARVFSGSLDDGFQQDTKEDFTVFDRPLPATWSAITNPVPVAFFQDIPPV